jgi:hypothetical protein
MIDVGKHRSRAGHHDRESAVGRRERRRDHFVAGPNPERHDRQRERVGARADADRVFRAGGRRELLFEGLELGAENEPSAGDDAIDGGADVGRVFRRREGEKRDCHVAGTYSPKCSR